ncbi:MAG TPA: SagB/ThcOx family dehydrogenase [Candidatus Binataceae bacterium]|nr:SagB/ThcOx family dehydrogenase [Candidatus Binataceae bacterium]
MASDRTAAARAYHELTAHSYTSVRSDGHILDWDNKPFPFKIYPQSGLALPRDLHLSTRPTLATLAQGEIEPGRHLSLAGLTRVLYCAAGLTHHRRVGMEVYHFRAAASAGALYPIELYLASGSALKEELEPGLYHFAPADLTLRGLRRGDWREAIARAAAMHPGLAQAEAIIILSAMFWRSTWKYRARAYRYCYWDAGTIIANLQAAATAEQVRVQLLVNFVDRELELLLGVDGEREGVLALIGLGVGPVAPPSPDLGPLALETVPLSLQEVQYPELVAMHKASKLLTYDEVAALAAHYRPTPAPALPSSNLPNLGLGATLAARGSTRVFSPAGLPLAELQAILAASAVHLGSDFPPLSSSYLIVNAIDGIEPGSYHYDGSSGKLELLKAGNFRQQARYLCLEQALGGDAAALLIWMGSWEKIAELGDRGYRAAQLEAGIAAGRAYLAAYSLGRGASGLTFYDDDTTAFLSPHAASKIALLMLAIGVPA